jgi:hypothetical protein
MLNLYWKSGDRTRSLVEKPFTSEAEFEKYILDNQDLLGDIYIIFRQVRTGSREGRPDMLGVDQDGRVCIIELKNVEASEDILPQALGYALWAETNPDSIKAIWLECKQRPEDIEINWDSLDLRIMLIAPAFKSTVQRMAGKIGYPIDLIQVRRYSFESEEFLLVDLVEPEPTKKAGVTKVTEAWDWAYYEQEHGSEATAQFRRTVDALASLVQNQGWDVPHNLNKYYTGFKLGTRIVFSVNWGGTYAWKVCCRLPEGVADGFKGQDWEFQTYDQTFRLAIFRPLRPDAPDIEELLPFLTQAYHYVAGS